MIRSNDELEKLRKQIDERIAFLKTVTDFARMIAAKRGKRFDYEERDDHINATYDLQNFGGFHFYVETSRSTLVRISRSGSNGDTCLDVKWGWGREVANGKVNAFDERSMQWQSDLLDVIKNWEQIGASLDSAADAETAAKQARIQQDQRTEELQTAARRLKIFFV